MAPMFKKILKLYGLALLLGVLVGLLGSFFRLAVTFMSEALHSFFQNVSGYGLPVPWVSALVSMVFVLLAYGAVRRYAPEAAGSGVQEIEGALLHVRKIMWKRLLAVKFFFGLLALSAKMVIGREGPTIHLGGALGEMLGELFSLTRRRADSLVAAGAGAGLAVAFNAPLAGVIFVIEEMRNQFNYSFTNFTVVVVSCLVSTLVMSCILGIAPTLPMPIFAFPELPSMVLFALFGFMIGVVGLLFNQSLMRSLWVMDKLSANQKTVFVALVGLVVGYLAVTFPSLVGDGTELIQKNLANHPSFSVLCVLFLLRFIGTMACYSTSVPGGIFAPILALGTVLGLAMFEVAAFFHIDASTEAGVFAVAGMAALFSAATRAPITGAVLIVELTQNYLLVFPVMISCIAATIVMQLANNAPIYTQLLERGLKSQE